METRRAPRPDAKPYDEIRIITVPYFKQSPTGSEWRTTRQLILLRKGKAIKLDICQETMFGIAETLDNILRPIENNLSKVAEHLIGESELCDQEGCTLPSCVTFRMRWLYDNDANPINPYDSDERPLIRKFCSSHARRGEGYYEDEDDNYEIIQVK